MNDEQGSRNIDRLDLEMLRNETAQLFQILLPAHLTANGKIMTEAEAEQYIVTVMQWITRSPARDGEKTDRET